MPFASGQRITPGRLNALQPRTYYKVGSGTVPASSTNAPVPDGAITVTTVSPGATFEAIATFEMDPTAATTALMLGRITVDGAAVGGPLATYASSAASDRGTTTQVYQGTLAAAGSHTIALIATTGANQIVQGVNCALSLTIYEAY